ncbi:MAG: VCBS repeat-containing protein [Acidobacteriales bacterium]|nr:VCBS repeat-containing protein [Terriglobales bacterium]
MQRFLIGKNFVGGRFVAIGDFNGDGKPDVFVDSYNDYVFPGNGDGTFGTYVLTKGCNAYAAQIADFNRDGKLDLIRSCDDNTEDAQFLTGQGDGTFQLEQSIAIGAAEREVVGDFNRDGAPDVAFSGSIYEAVLAVLLNTGAK